MLPLVLHFTRDRALSRVYGASRSIELLNRTLLRTTPTAAASALFDVWVILTYIHGIVSASFAVTCSTDRRFDGTKCAAYSITDVLQL